MIGNGYPRLKLLYKRLSHFGLPVWPTDEENIHPPAVSAPEKLF
jgi:hypothetical protein